MGYKIRSDSLSLSCKQLQQGNELFWGSKFEKKPFGRTMGRGGTSSQRTVKEFSERFSNDGPIRWHLWIASLWAFECIYAVSCVWLSPLFFLLNSDSSSESEYKFQSEVMHVE